MNKSGAGKTKVRRCDLARQMGLDAAWIYKGKEGLERWFSG